VVDDVTGAGLFGVQVTALRDGSTHQYSTQTDADGDYVLEASGSADPMITGAYRLPPTPGIPI
jgi:hypothetical protein